MTPKIDYLPYNDLSSIPENLMKDILLEIGRVMRLKNIQEHHRYVSVVEEKLARYFQTRHVVAVDSGTTALQLSLAALGVREGDEVIVPTYTYVATALAVTNLGATPVFVDVKPDDLTIDPDLIEANITSKTKAIIPVHIHGLCCDMAAITRLCTKHKITLIEDASQAHGALINGKKAGTFGIGCFSLHASKNLSAIGDAGCIMLNDDDLHDKIRNYLSPESGTKAALESRRTPCTMDAIQAAIIGKKLDVLDAINERKRQIAARYDALISAPNIRKPSALKMSLPVYRDYFILIQDRESLMARLLKEGIETKAGYVPLHLSDTFKGISRNQKNYPVADQVSRQSLLLPSFWGMTDDQVKRVCVVLQETISART